LNRRSRSAAAQHATCIELPEDGEGELLAENRLENAAKALATRAARGCEPAAWLLKRANPKRTMELDRGAAAVQVCDA